MHEDAAGCKEGEERAWGILAHTIDQPRLLKLQMRVRIAYRGGEHALMKLLQAPDSGS